MVNVGKYIPDMDPMGCVFLRISLVFTLFLLKIGVQLLRALHLQCCMCLVSNQRHLMDVEVRKVCVTPETKVIEKPYGLAVKSMVKLPFG